jgi:uncharacterized protein
MTANAEKGESKMKIELRSDSVFISGYVNAVGRDSRPIVSPNGKFVEMIEPGTFNEALTRAQNVDLLLNHNKMRKLGSISDGNLTLTEDSIGLRAECEIKDAEVIEKARNKQLRGWSFGMYVNNAEMENRAENVPRRHIRALDLFEVSIIDNQMLPCYAGTSVECRADGDVMSEMRATDDTEHEITEVKAAEPADYSRWEKRAAELANAPYEKRLEELRYNPYHDPTNGRFTSGSGGGMGFLFVGKGQKGKGAYVIPSEEFTDADGNVDIGYGMKASKKAYDAAKEEKEIMTGEKPDKGSVDFGLRRTAVDHGAENVERISLERLARAKARKNGVTDEEIKKTTEAKEYFKKHYQADKPQREITSSTYENAQRRLNRDINKFFGRGMESFSRAVPDLEYFEQRAKDDETEEITEVKAAEPVEPADYSEWEKRAAEFANAPYEKRLEELRYNPYHDPTNGKFTSGSGGGAGYLFVGKGAKGAGQYVVDSSYFAADKPKFLPEEIEETVDGYKITDKTVSSERGEVSNSGKYTEIKSLPPKNQAQINKIAKEKGIEDPVLVGGRMVVPRKVGDKAVAINQQARDNYKANLKNNVPGLDELEKVKADYNAEQRLFSKSIENGNGILHSPKVTSADVAEVGKKYPVASAYLKADGYSNSANYHKASAGETAKDRIRRGENYKQVLEDMEKEWEKSVEEHIWD